MNEVYDEYLLTGKAVEKCPYAISKGDVNFCELSGKLQTCLLVSSDPCEFYRDVLEELE